MLPVDGGYLVSRAVAVDYVVCATEAASAARQLAYVQVAEVRAVREAASELGHALDACDARRAVLAADRDAVAAQLVDAERRARASGRSSALWRVVGVSSTGAALTLGALLVLSR